MPRHPRRRRRRRLGCRRWRCRRRRLMWVGRMWLGSPATRCSGRPTGCLVGRQVGTVGADVVSFSDTGLGCVDQLLLPGVCDQCQWCLGAVGSGERDHRCPATPATAGDTGWGVGGGGVGVGDRCGLAGCGWGVRVHGAAVGQRCVGWTQVGTAGADVVSFSDTGLAASTSYYYRVFATNASGDSAPSAVAQRRSTPPPPRRWRRVGCRRWRCRRRRSMWVGRMWLGSPGTGCSGRRTGCLVGPRSGPPGLDVVSFSDTGLGRVDQLLLSGACVQCQWCFGAVGSGQRDYGAGWRRVGCRRWRCRRRRSMWVGRMWLGSPGIGWSVHPMV